MNKYESVIIMKPDLTKSELENVIVKVESKIGEYANITAKDDYGIRRLAYEVKKNKEGHYYIFQFEINEENKTIAIQEIERLYKITDEIIKFLAERQIETTISLDGTTKEMHEFLRGKNTYEKTMEKIWECKNAGVPLILSMTVHKKNQDTTITSNT